MVVAAIVRRRKGDDPQDHRQTLISRHAAGRPPYGRRMARLRRPNGTRSALWAPLRWGAVAGSERRRHDEEARSEGLAARRSRVARNRITSHAGACHSRRHDLYRATPCDAAGGSWNIRCADDQETGCDGPGTGLRPANDDSESDLPSRLPHVRDLGRRRQPRRRRQRRPPRGPLDRITCGRSAVEATRVSTPRLRPSKRALDLQSRRRDSNP
jgi:hypothetical protein